MPQSSIELSQKAAGYMLASANALKQESKASSQSVKFTKPKELKQPNKSKKSK